MILSSRIPTPRNAVREYKGKKRLETGAYWDSTSLVKILRSPTIIGESTVSGQTFRDKSGLAVKRAEPLIDRETWEQVKSILADNAAHIGPRMNVSPLLRVAYCAKCKSPMYSHSANPKKSGQKYRYYYCVKAMRKRGCTARRIRADLLETLVETTLLADIGNQSLTEEETVPASDNSTAMAELAEAIGALASQIALARAHGHDTSDLEAQQQINESNLAGLAHEPTRHAETIEHDTGETWAERWQRLDWNKRNSLLRRKGIKFWAERDDEGLPKVISN